MGGRGLVPMVLGVALLARAVFASFDAYHHHWGRGAIVINVLADLIARSTDPHELDDPDLPSVLNDQVDQQAL